MALSRMPRIRDSSSENVFGIYNGSTVEQFCHIFEVRAAAESGFICRVTLFNGDDLG